MKKIMKPFFYVLMMTIATHRTLAEESFFSSTSPKYPVESEGKRCFFCHLLFFLIDFPRKYFAVNILCLSLSRKSIFLVAVI